MKPVEPKSVVNPGPKEIPMEAARKLRRHMNSLEKSIRNTTTWQNYRDKIIIEMALQTGLRREELQWVDVDDARLDLMPVIGKGRKKRQVPILSDLRAMLDRYIHEKDRRGERVESEECDCGKAPGCPVCLGSGIAGAPLFMSRKGNRLSLRQINLIFEKRCREAGIGHFTPHSFRHRFSRSFLERSENPAAAVGDLSTLLGHSKVETTHIYLKNSVPQIAALMEKRA